MGSTSSTLQYGAVKGSNSQPAAMEQRAKSHKQSPLAKGTAVAHGKLVGGQSRRLRQLPLTWRCCDSAEQAGAEVTAMSQTSGQPSSSSSSSSRGGVAAQHGKVGRIRLQHHHSCLRPQQLEQNG